MGGGEQVRGGAREEALEGPQLGLEHSGGATEELEPKAGVTGPCAHHGEDGQERGDRGRETVRLTPPTLPVVFTRPSTLHDP